MRCTIYKKVHIRRDETRENLACEGRTAASSNVGLLRVGQLAFLVLDDLLGAAIHAIAHRLQDDADSPVEGVQVRIQKDRRDRIHLHALVQRGAQSHRPVVVPAHKALPNVRLCFAG